MQKVVGGYAKRNRLSRNGYGSAACTLAMLGSILVPLSMLGAIIGVIAYTKTYDANGDRGLTVGGLIFSVTPGLMWSVLLVALAAS